MKQRIESGLRDTRDALTKKDAELAAQRAESLGKTIKEAGVVICSQTPQAKEPFKETRVPGEGIPSSEPRPTGSGPRGRVVDAEYRESR